MSVDTNTISFENLVDFVWNGQEMAQNLMHPFVQDDSIQEFANNPTQQYRDYKSDWYTRNEPKYDLDEHNHEYNPYGPNGGNNDFEIGDVIDELPEYDVNDLSGDLDPLDYFKYYRWAINAVVIGVPWTTAGFASFAYNMYFNVAWNKFWASGNAFLILNSVYLFVQVTNSIPLLFEIPIWLRAFRVTRLLSFFSAIIYNIVFIISALEWYDQIYLVTDKSAYDFGMIMVNMLLGYNLILHCSIIPINFAIIVKEISLNFFSFSGKRRENEAAPYLNEGDLEEAEKDINPLHYVDEYIMEPEFGYDAEDYLIENPDDEEHYIGNWGKDKKDLPNREYISPEMQERIRKAKEAQKKKN